MTNLPSRFGADPARLAALRERFEDKSFLPIQPVVPPQPAAPPVQIAKPQTAPTPVAAPVNRKVVASVPLARPSTRKVLPEAIKAFGLKKCEEDKDGNGCGIVPKDAPVADHVNNCSDLQGVAIAEIKDKANRDLRAGRSRFNQDQIDNLTELTKLNPNNPAHRERVRQLTLDGFAKAGLS